MTKRSPTTKAIGLLHQLFSNGQLTLAPEFQRNSVWPNAAKAYLIDTILNDRPIPLASGAGVALMPVSTPIKALV
jgi:hypothetical protein